MPPFVADPQPPDPLPPSLDTGRGARNGPHPRRSLARKPPSAPPGSDPGSDEAVPAPPPAAVAPLESVQITADVPPAAADDQRRNTEQLLQSAENSLRRVTRSLSESERAMMQQAQSYASQARAAVHDGDLERAHNLAVKASLLANALAR